MFTWFRRKPLSRALLDSAEVVAESFRSGHYSDLADSSWEQAWDFLIERLREREPGHSMRDYREALDAGFQATR